MAIRKVGPNACFRELVPIVYFAIVSTGLKLFSAGSSETLLTSSLYFVHPSLGWKLFSASSPERKFHFSWNRWFSMLLYFTVLIGSPYVGWKLFSASSLAALYVFVYLITGIRAGWKLFSAGSLATKNGYNYVAIIIGLFGGTDSYATSDISISSQIGRLSACQGFMAACFSLAVCALGGSFFLQAPQR